jgi:hypothetical protein
MVLYVKDEFAKRYLKLIKAAKSDEELIAIINKIYEDGFYDGNVDNEPIPRL